MRAIGQRAVAGRNVGAFVHAGARHLRLSPRAGGRILARRRELYDLAAPAGGEPPEAKAMSFDATRRHQYWSIDVRRLDTPLTKRGHGPSVMLTAR